MLEGWKCPNCGRINAPFVSCCPCKDPNNIPGVIQPPFYPVPYNPWLVPYPYYPWDGTIVVTYENNAINYSVTANKKE